MYGQEHKSMNSHCALQKTFKMSKYDRIPLASRNELNQQTRDLVFVFLFLYVHLIHIKIQLFSLRVFLFQLFLVEMEMNKYV